MAENYIYLYKNDLKMPVYVYNLSIVNNIFTEVDVCNCLLIYYTQMIVRSSVFRFFIIIESRIVIKVNQIR